MVISLLFDSLRFVKFDKPFFATLSTNARVRNQRSNYNPVSKLKAPHTYSIT